MNMKHFFSRRTVRIALVTVTALLCMAVGWRQVPAEPQPTEPAITAQARAVAIGGAQVEHGGISALQARSTVATLAGSSSWV